MAVAAAAQAAPAPARASAPPHYARPALRLVQRSCACGGEAGPSGSCEPCNSARLQTQRAAGAPAAAGLAPAIVYSALRSPGRPLDAATRAAAEPRLGHDFSRVRIHTGPLADASARAVNAHSYTVGQDIVFAAGQYRPGTPVGDRLLAHELTHTVQQSGATIGFPLRIGPADDMHERAAATASSSWQAPSTPSPAVRLQRQVVQRQPADAPAVAAPTAVPAAAAGPAPAADTAPAPEEPGLLWAVVKRIVPAALLDVIQGIRSKGIVGYLRDRVTGVFGRVFGRLGEGGGFITGLLLTFTQLAAALKNILGALAHNDCKPLFDAIAQLGDTLQEMAGEAWDRIKAFFAPIGDFFSELWTKFGAPAVDFLAEYAAEQWNEIKSLGARLWELSAPIRDALAAAWDWLKRQLGIGDGEDDQNGLLQWVERKLGEAWDWIKKQAEPVITPIKAFAARVAAILPIDAILNLRERVHEWLSHAGDMVRSLQKPQGVTADQTSLRDKILPAIKASIVALGGRIADAGTWAAHQIGGIVQSVLDMFGALRASAILSPFAGAIAWIEQKINALGEWVKSGVKALFDIAGQGVARLAGFVDPLLGVLQKLVSVIADVVKALPDLVLGPLWKLIPACIKDPIKDFVIQHILSAIPVISTFVKVPEIWGKIKQLVLDFLATVFVKGDLAGAALMVIRFVLEAAGVKVDLFFSVIGKAIEQIDQILMHPLDFLKNVFSALKQGFEQFFAKIGSYLLQGLLSWILGPLEELGVKPPREFTLASVLDLVLQILGITGAKLRKKLEAAVGPTAVKVIESAWGWLSTLITKGPVALWEQIKGQLSNLWEMVIGGIAQWITVDLIKAGIVKLAELSNIAGAVIELIRTIYTTFEFIVTKLNRILALVDAVLDSIGNIVKGQIGPAANFIEQALAKGVASVIAFLADWLGISDPGEKIREIVEKIQGTVDRALDWLINQAIAIGRSLLAGLGIGDKPDERTPAQKEQDLDAGLAEAKAFAGRPDADVSLVRKELPQIQRKYRLKQLDLVWETEDEWDIIGDNSPAKKIKVELAPGDLETVITYGPTNAERGASWMKAHPLTPNHPTGSAPSASPGVWEKIRPDVLKREGVGLYVRGHLLNERLGGPGTEENLTPITYSANANHLNAVERHLKSWINAPKRDRMVHYEVQVDPPAGVKPPPGVIAEETVLAADLSWSWYELAATGPDPDHPTFKPKAGGEADSDKVKNVPDWPHVTL